MVDISQGLTPQLVTTDVHPVSDGAAFQRPSAETLGPGLSALGSGLDDLSVSLAKSAGREDAADAVSRDANGNLQVTLKPPPIMLGKSAAAYDQAVQAGTVAFTDSIAQKQVTDLRAQFPNDPAGFGKAVGDLAESLRSRWDGPIGQQAFETVTRLGDQNYSSLVAQKASTDISNAQTAVEGQVKDQISSMNALARQSGTGTPEFQRAAARLDGWYEQLGKNPAFGYSADRIAQERARAYDEIKTQGVIGDVDRWKSEGVSADDIRARIKAQITDNSNLKLSDQQRNALTSWAESRLAYQTDQTKADIRANSAAVQGMVTMFTNGKGQVPTDAQFDAILQRSKGLGDFDSTMQLTAAREAYLHQRPLMQMSPSDRGAALMGNGLGNINTVYQGALDASAPGMPSPKTMYDYLTSKGATKNEALMLTGAAASESGLNPNTPHDGGIGYGLFGHNGARLDAMRAAAGTFLPNWQQQASFALSELRSRPEGAAVNAAKDTGDLARAQMAYEQPQGYTAASPESGHNFTGRYNTLNRFAVLSGMPQGAVPAAPVIPFSPQQIAANPYLVSSSLAAFNGNEAVQKTMARDLGTSLQSRITAGYMPEPQQVAAYTQVASRFPDMADDVTRVTQGIRAMGTGAAAVQSGAGDRVVQEAENIARANPSLANIEYAKAVQRSVQQQQHDLDKDPRAYASRPDVGWTPARAPLPDFGQEIGARRMEAQQIASHTGGDPAALMFSKNDIGDMTKVMATGAPDARASLMSGLSSMSPAEQAALASDKDFSGAVTGMFKSGDTQKMGQAFGFMDKQFVQNPVMFEGKYGADTVAQMKVYQDLIQFLGPDEAAKRINTWNDPSVARARQTLETQADDVVKNMDVHGATAQFRGYVPFTGPNDPTSDGPQGSGAEVLDDYRQAYKLAYTYSGGDKKIAADHASEMLAKKWGASDINGGRVMAYPPERYYPADPMGSQAYVGQQLDEAIRAHLPDGGDADTTGNAFASLGGAMAPLGGPSPEKTGWQAAAHNRVMIADDTTKADIQAGKPPSYRVVYTDDKGRMQALEQSPGVAMRFRADPRAAADPARAELARRHAAFVAGSAAVGQADPAMAGAPDAPAFQR